MKSNQPEHDEAAAFDATVERLRHTHAIVGDSSFSELVTRFHSQFSDTLNRAYAEDIIDWLRDEGLMGNSRALQTPALPLWMAKFVKMLRYAKEHTNSTALYALLHVWDDPVLDALNGYMNQTDFAASIGLDKAAVNNAVIDAQRHFGTPPRRDQRQAAARQTMSQVRIGKLVAPAAKGK